MKKLANLLLAACMILTLSACTDGDGPIQEVVETPAMEETETPVVPSDVQTTKPLFEGKIAIISNEGGQSEEYDSAQMMVEKYGKNKVVHVTWPVNYMSEQEQMLNIVTKLGANTNVKAIIVNRAVLGTNAAFDKLKETRKDIFIIYIDTEYNFTDGIQIADMVLSIDKLGMGPAMVRQAQKLGSKTFVYYSFTRHTSQTLLGAHRDLISETCMELGIEFVDAIAKDPSSEVGVTGAQQFILDDVPKMVAKYGEDTAFFATHCSLQPPLVEAVVDTGAIYPQPCCPSPYHGIILALNLEFDIYVDESMLPVQDIIAKERAALAEKKMLGRVSTWPDTSSNLLTAASAEYAIKWINGEVPKEGIDVDVLKQLMEDYAGVEVFLTPYKDEYPYTENGTGETYENFLLMRMDYITF